MLKRSAYFLRVVECKGVFDALDQLNDSPRPEERLYAYRIVGKPGMAFVDGPKVRGCYPIAIYEFIPEQPTDDQMRSSDAWHNWCCEHRPKSFE